MKQIIGYYKKVGVGREYGALIAYSCKAVERLSGKRTDGYCNYLSVENV